YHKLDPGSPCIFYRVMKIPANNVPGNDAPLLPETGCQLQSSSAILFLIEQENSGCFRSLHAGSLFHTMKKIKHIEGKSCGRNRAAIAAHKAVIPSTAADRRADRRNKSLKSYAGVVGKTSYLAEIDSEFVPDSVYGKYLDNLGKIVQRTPGTIISYRRRGFLNYIRTAEHSRKCRYFGLYRVRDILTFKYRSYRC